MLKQLALKKQHLFTVATIVLLFTCYQLALKKTVEAWQINNKLRTEIAQASDLRYQPAYLERKYSNLNNVISCYQTDTAAFRSSIISAISTIAEKENVKLSEVPLDDPQYHTELFTIQKLDFEGDFFSLTKLLNRLQFTNGIGMIRAASYRSIVVGQNKYEARKLRMEIHLIEN